MKHSSHGAVACYLHARKFLRAASGERRRHQPQSLGRLWIRESGASRTASIVAGGTPSPGLILLTDSRLPAGSNVELYCPNHRDSFDIIPGRIGESRPARRATDLPQCLFVARFEPSTQDPATGVTVPGRSPVDDKIRIGGML